MKIEKKMVRDLSLHPQNNFAPDNSGPEWDAFVANIKEQGLKHPIVVDKKNRIVSGQRRWLAHQALGLRQIDCLVENYANDEEARHAVIDLNLHTRHLTDKQRFVLFEERYGKDLNTLLKKGVSVQRAVEKLGIQSHKDRAVRLYNKFLKQEFAGIKSEQALEKTLAHMPERKKKRILSLREKAIKEKASFRVHLDNYQKTCKELSHEIKLVSVGLHHVSLFEGKMRGKGGVPALGLPDIDVENKFR